MTVSKAQKQQKLVRSVENSLFVARHTEVKVDGHLSKHEKKLLAKTKAARGLPGNAKVDKKTEKSLRKMANQIGHDDQFVLGSSTPLIAQAEQRYLKQGLIKKKNADGILDPKTKQLMQAEQAAAGQNNFDGQAYEQYYQSQFPRAGTASQVDPQLAGYVSGYDGAFPQTPVDLGGPDPRLAGYAGQYNGAFPQTPGANPQPDPQLAAYVRTWQSAFPASSNGGQTVGTPSGTVNSGDVVTPAPVPEE